MSERQLKTVTRTQGNNLALKDGSVRPQTFDFAFEEVPVLVDAFRRMVRGLEFDICEMALTTYLCARAHGKRFTALPIFLVRAFHHGAILVNTKAGIATLISVWELTPCSRRIAIFGRDRFKNGAATLSLASKLRCWCTGGSGPAPTQIGRAHV